MLATGNLNSESLNAGGVSARTMPLASLAVIIMMPLAVVIESGHRWGCQFASQSRRRTAVNVRA